MYTLTLYDRLLASSTAYRMDITRHALDWRRSIRAIGGFWMGDFTLTQDTMPARTIKSIFATSIGKRVVEKTAMAVSWEGEIVQMELEDRGLRYRTSMDNERFHNRVKVIYEEASTNTTTATAWSANTSSSDIYGESEYIDVLSSPCESAAATALRDRRLVERAYPRPFPVGGLETQSDPDTPTFLSVTVAGFVYGINRQYRESDTAAGNLSAQIETLIGESEFVTVGRVESNTTQVPIEASEAPIRLWDQIDDFIGMGDTSGNRWIGGVYADQKFYYEQAETSVTHYWKNGRLLDLGHRPVPPTLAKPNMIVRIADMPIGILPPGTSNDMDDPKNVYIEAVEFIAPNHLRLIPYENA